MTVTSLTDEEITSMKNDLREKYPAPMTWFGDDLSNLYQCVTSAPNIAIGMAHLIDSGKDTFMSIQDIIGKFSKDDWTNILTSAQQDVSSGATTGLSDDTKKIISTVMIGVGAGLGALEAVCWFVAGVAALVPFGQLVSVVALILALQIALTGLAIELVLGLILLWA